MNQAATYYVPYRTLAFRLTADRGRAGDVVWQFGPYRIEGLIARGGMGEVHRAYDTRHDRVVALKLLAESAATDEEFRERFKREAHAAARLREPHVIPIHAFGEIDGRLYLDMRLVEGQDLRNRLAEHGPMSPAEAVDVVSQIASALDAAHADGLLHRDVKPSNIIIGTNGFAYLVDFGIVRSVSTNTDITGTGDTVGTIAYMAPERFSHEPLDHRVDVYSLACVLYQCLTGIKPYSGENALAIMFAHVKHEPPKPSAHHAEMGTRFDQVIALGMAKNRDERYATAGELAAAARSALTSSGTKRLPMLVQEPEPPVKPRRPGRWIAAVTAVLLAAAVGTFFWLQPDKSAGGGSQPGPSTPSIPSTSSTSATTKGVSAPAPDLNVSTPISKPPCDGSYIVLVGSAATPDLYAKSVQDFLNLFPGSKYLHAPSTGCSSLKTRHDPTNADIYAVFYGPFRAKQAACDQKAALGGDSFVRRLDNTSSPERGVSC